ncbi:MAG: methanogenesis marker 8 protein [Candidatus Omnitrophota bacterium]
MNKNVQRDIHILRYFSSFISVSKGKVINVTDPKITFCPLASHLYKGLKNIDGTDQGALKGEIKRIIESKIKDFGFFTSQRKLLQGETAIPYGASEMLMFALKKKIIDAAVVVCDGAGTVITDSGEVVQGIGARMNSLLLTSPIKETIDHLINLGCHVLFDNALIDQVKGVEKAIAAGYKKIAVTVSGHDVDKLKKIRQLESASHIMVTILVVCTTGIVEAKIEQIHRYADVVWSCASLDIRQKIGEVALLQASKQIPVFVLTQKGIDFLASYADDAAPLRDLDRYKQYLISNEPVGEKIKLGDTRSFLREKKLPALSEENFVRV